MQTIGFAIAAIRFSCYQKSTKFTLRNAVYFQREEPNERTLQILATRENTSLPHPACSSAFSRKKKYT